MESQSGHHDHRVMRFSLHLQLRNTPRLLRMRRWNIVMRGVLQLPEPLLPPHIVSLLPSRRGAAGWEQIKACGVLGELSAQSNALLLFHIVPRCTARRISWPASLSACVLHTMLPRLPHATRSLQFCPSLLSSPNKICTIRQSQPIPSSSCDCIPRA
jgi:hypothetical protein